jgi:hypothetical protein
MTGVESAAGRVFARNLIAPKEAMQCASMNVRDPRGPRYIPPSVLHERAQIRLIGVCARFVKGLQTSVATTSVG